MLWLKRHLIGLWTDTRHTLVTFRRLPSRQDIKKVTYSATIQAKISPELIWDCFKLAASICESATSGECIRNMESQTSIGYLKAHKSYEAMV